MINGAAPHTKILAKYLDAWYPIIASWNGRMVFLDGFAGRGRYTDGSEGSPLVALKRLLDHRSWPAMSHREFVFVFVERDKQNADWLQAEMDAFKAKRQPWPANVKTQVVHGTFGQTATEIIEQLRAQKAKLAPTFAFIDPFGYSGLPMKLLAELLAYPIWVKPLSGSVAMMYALAGAHRVKRSRPIE